MSDKTSETSLAMTVAEFCASARIARSNSDQLRREGKAPPSIRLGKRRLIRREAADPRLKALERA